MPVRGIFHSKNEMMNWGLFMMADDKNRIKRQVNGMLRSYNRQRVGLVLVILLFSGILFFSPVVGMGTLPVRLSVFCSAVLFLCSAGFALSLRDSLLLLFMADGVMGVLFGLHQIRLELFFVLLLINAGTVFRSNLTVKALVRSLTEESDRVSRLETAATTDSLTRLLNRSGLERAAEPAWALCKRDQKNIGVILADIDFFKNYNDTLGHLEGDRILKQVADSMKNCFMRETDLISRIGGDEFLILLPDIKETDLLETAHSLSSSIIQLNVSTAMPAGPCSFLSVSMGIAVSTPQPDDLLIDLYRTVDQALYDAKRAGRNCISFHEKLYQSGPPWPRRFQAIY